MSDPFFVFFTNYFVTLCLILFYKLFGEIIKKPQTIYWLYALIDFNETKIASTSNKKFL